MKISKIKEHIGAQATGIDLREPVGEEDFQELHDVLDISVTVY
jgi:alpha-ketoglutarate-dependent taurine dioxygenase